MSFQMVALPPDVQRQARCFNFFLRTFPPAFTCGGGAHVTPRVFQARGQRWRGLLAGVAAELSERERGDFRLASGLCREGRRRLVLA